MKYWTITADVLISGEKYGSELYVPENSEQKFNGFLDYIAINNILFASCKISRIYKYEFKTKQQGFNHLYYTIKI